MIDDSLLSGACITTTSGDNASLVVLAADEMKGRRGNDSWVELEGGFVVCVAGGFVVVRGSFFGESSFVFSPNWATLW